MSGTNATYRPLPPPLDLPPDNFFWRELLRISDVLERTGDFAPLTQAPLHPEEGMQRFADGVGWNPGSGKGMYEFKDGSWQPLFGAASALAGFYDPVTDLVESGIGATAALPAANDPRLVPGNYYSVTVAGVCTSPHANINGVTMAVGDLVLTDGNVWEHQPVAPPGGDTYLRKDVADTAAGHITLAAGGTTIAPTLTGHIARLADATNEANSAVTGHNSDAGAHQGRITANETKNTQQDGRLDAVEAKDVEQDGRLDIVEQDLQDQLCDCAEHIANPDPHPQYVLETVALQTFAFAAYGGMQIGSPPVIPAWDIPALSWQTLDFFDALSIDVPRGITVSLPSNSLSVDNEGVYVASVVGSFEHNSSNQGRITYLRLFNQTDGISGNPKAIGIGRNTEASNFSVTLLVNIAATDLGKQFVVQIGGGDAVTVIDFLATGFDVWNVGEWRGSL